MEPQKSPKPFRAASPIALVYSLLALAVISVTLGLAAGLIVLTRDLLEKRVGLLTLLWVIAAFVAGCCVGGVLWALAWLCRRQHQGELAQRRMVRALELLAGPPAGGPEETSVQAEEVKDSSAGAAGLIGPEQLRTLVAELRELNVNILLSEDQRRAKREYVIQTQAKRLAGQIEQAADSGDLPAAEEHLDRLLRVAPDWPRMDELKQFVEKARAEGENRQIRHTRRKVEDLMSAGQFDQAGAHVEDLLFKHPASPDAISLLARVRREAEAFENERRQRVFGQLEKDATARHWRAALSAAETFLAAYASAPEADTVRAQLETIRSNARIEEVRELRDQIRDLINRRRFAEAAERARDVVERFPDTAAAAELRGQMNRLEELARAAQGGGA
jgi:uncharacterized membrane protein YciS (DUF1049 family)